MVPEPPGVHDMKVEPKKLVLSKETLRKLTKPQPADAVKFPTTTVMTRYRTCTES